MSDYDAAQVVEQFSHVGVCVTDMERSRRFYAEGLGFRSGVLMMVEDKYHGLLGFEGAKKLVMHNQFMRLGGVVIELIKFDAPELLPAGDAPRPFNRVGLTHLSFRVKDVNAVSKKLESLGGRIHESTRTVEDMAAGVSGAIIFCTDPDGTRIELMQYPPEVVFA